MLLYLPPPLSFISSGRQTGPRNRLQQTPWPQKWTCSYRAILSELSLLLDFKVPDRLVVKSGILFFSQIKKKVDLHRICKKKCVARSGSRLHQSDKVSSAWLKEQLLHVKEARVWPIEDQGKNDVTGQQHASNMSLIKLSFALLGKHWWMTSEFSLQSTITWVFLNENSL